MIPIFSNTLGSDETDAVARVFASRWLGPGKQVAGFEREWLEHLGGQGQALLMNCCTSALYIALRVMGLPNGSKVALPEVIMPSVHFVATANAVLELGGMPVFCDCDPHTLNARVEDIEPLVTPATVGVVILHYGGHPADIEPIRGLCKARGLWLVEDAANAPASTWHGQAVGTLGDAGVWSFDSMKVLVMGDGGALWLPGEKQAEQAARMRNMGLDTFSGTDALKSKRDRWWEFGVKEPSGRFASNDIAAAVGRVQLCALAGFVQRRAEVWDVYQHELAGVWDLVLPPEPARDCTSSYYLYWVQTERRDALARYLVDKGIYCTFRYFPLHLAFRDTTARCPNAVRANERGLCLPLHQNLSDGDVDKIVTTVKEFYRG